MFASVYVFIVDSFCLLLYFARYLIVFNVRKTYMCSVLYTIYIQHHINIDFHILHLHTSMHFFRLYIYWTLVRNRGKNIVILFVSFDFVSPCVVKYRHPNSIGFLKKKKIESALLTTIRRQIENRTEIRTEPNKRKRKYRTKKNQSKRNILRWQLQTEKVFFKCIWLSLNSVN